MSNDATNAQAPKKKRKKWPIILVIVVAVIVVLFAILSSGPSVNDGASYTKDNLLTAEETDKMFNSTGDYIGQSVDLYGQIFNEVSSDSDGTVFQMYCDPEKAEKDVMVYVESGYKVETDKIVLVKGVITDTYTGNNAFGAEITCPLISAKSVEDAAYTDAFAPALKTVKPGAQLEVGEVKITVDKVEFAEKETRLSITFVNNSSASADIAVPSSSIVQNGKQYEYQENYDAEYETFPDDVKSGVSASGVLVFPAIEQTDFELFLNVSVNYEGYVEKEISISVS